MLSGNIFKIQGFSTFDGPGIRTAIFLKGCPLRCKWCFNPESQKGVPEVLHYPDNCIQCGICANVCQQGAVLPSKTGRFIDKSRCIDCLKCAYSCPTDAMRIYGREASIEQIVSECLKDRAFYAKKGGVTLTGGEVLYQPEFAIAILKACKDNGLNTAIETCGYGKSEHLLEMLKYTDHLMFDIKCIDAVKHERFTGKRNELILRNARLASENHSDMTICIPVIPSFNDDDKELCAIADFICSLPKVSLVDIRPYSLAGISKYDRLFRKYELDKKNTLDSKRIEEISLIFASRDLKVNVGG